jgi:hypothetical protein
MKRTLLPALLLLIAGPLAAQVCTPNTLYQDSLYGIWPDTTTNFAVGVVNEPYTQQLDLIVPQNAGVVNPLFEGVVLDSVQFLGVQGLPPGLSVACASQTPASCSYLTGQLGCGLIQGTPITTGTFNLTLSVRAFANLFGNPVPIEQQFGGYRIIITNGQSVNEIMAPQLAGVRNVPNPFGNRTHVEFQLGRAGDVRVRVFNLLGEELWSTLVQGRAGTNRVLFDASNMPEGVYLYKVESGREAFTGRMLLNR